MTWCNTLRTLINTKAEGIPGQKRVIIDVESGDGQSLGSKKIGSSEVSNILVEPSRAKCVKLCKLLNVKVPELALKTSTTVKWMQKEG